MINTKNLKHRLMAVRFALWDLHLYTDTHGCDCETRKLTETLRRQCDELLKEYECKYGPLTSMNNEDCTWAETPFPWVSCGGDF